MSGYFKNAGRFPDQHFLWVQTVKSFPHPTNFKSSDHLKIIPKYFSWANQTKTCNIPG
jgi:hypothetical protein